MKPATFTMTPQQLDGFEQAREKTGLNQVEIVRRALDDYRDVSEVKAGFEMFTKGQKKDIKVVWICSTSYPLVRIAGLAAVILTAFSGFHFSILSLQFQKVPAP